MTKITNDQLAIVPYTLQSYLVATPPTVSTTYLAAMGFSAVTTSNEPTGRIYFPSGGTVKQVYVWYRHAGTNGSTETSTIYFRINNTTDYVVAANIVTATTANNALYVLTPSSPITVAAGDFFTLKWTTPAWATPPGQPYFQCTVLVA